MYELCISMLRYIHVYNKKFYSNHLQNNPVFDAHFFANITNQSVMNTTEASLHYYHKQYSQLDNYFLSQTQCHVCMGLKLLVTGNTTDVRLNV